MSRYDALREMLAARSELEVVMTFTELEVVIGALPPSARLHPAWWANSVVGHAHAAAWLDAGRVAKPDFLRAQVVFAKGAPQSRPSSPSAPLRSGQRTVPARRAQLTPIFEVLEVTLRFEWLSAGAVTLAGGRLVMPRLDPVPGIYRFELLGLGRSAYVGETDNLERRMGNYRTPGVGQPTNVRMNRRLIDVLADTGSVELAVVLGAAFDDEPLDFTARPARLLVENAALVNLDAGGIPIENL